MDRRAFREPSNSAVNKAGMMYGMAAGDWSTTEHVVRYFARADAYPRRGEGEAALLKQVPVALVGFST